MKWIQLDLAGLAVCTGITAAAYLTVYQPLAQAEAQRESHVAELAVRQEKADKLSATINNLRQELAKLQKSASENPIELQSAQHSNKRLAELTHLAGENKLDLNLVRTGDVIAGSRYDVIPIYLAGYGTYASCTGFLHQLRARFPDTGVIGMDLADNPADTEDKTAFKFDLSWYAATSVSSAAK